MLFISSVWTGGMIFWLFTLWIIWYSVRWLFRNDPPLSQNEILRKQHILQLELHCTDISFIHQVKFIMATKSKKKNCLICMLWQSEILNGDFEFEHKLSLPSVNIAGGRHKGWWDTWKIYCTLTYTQLLWWSLLRFCKIWITLLFFVLCWTHLPNKLSIVHTNFRFKVGQYIKFWSSFWDIQIYPQNMVKSKTIEERQNLHCRVLFEKQIHIPKFRLK